MQSMLVYTSVPVVAIILCYTYLTRKKGQRKEVMLLRPNDGRFATLPVDRETDEGLYCRKVGGVQHRFYKTGPGWTGNLVRFLGVEGTPLISYIKEGTKKIETPVSEFLKFVWGEGPYKKLPNALKKPLEEGIGLIVTVDPIIPDKKYHLDQVMADAILTESDIANLDEFGKGTPKKEAMKELVANAIQILLGAFAMYFAVHQGWF